MPVSSTAMRASGMRSRLAASAAARKIASTFSCGNVAYSFCAARTRASIASSSEMPQSGCGAAGAGAGDLSFSFMSFVGGVPPPGTPPFARNGEEDYQKSNR